jgi:tetratricopeptide (TPR) repeat protein
MHNCRKYCLMVGCLLVLCPLLRAQDTLTSATVESESYSLYMQKNWDELISFGNKALRKGFDYYYLRYRLGVSYFAEKKYLVAQVHFEKAIAFNSTDEAMEYLYYCYIYTQQYERARWLSKSFSHDAIAYTGSDKLKAFSFATLEGGIGTSDSSRLFQNETYVQAGAGIFVDRRFSLFQAFTYFNQKAFRGDINQAQYYIGGAVPLKNGWSFSSGIQPIYTSSTTEYTKIDSVIAGPPPLKGEPPRRRAEVVDSAGAAKGKLNFVWAGSITKSFSHFDFTLGTAIGAFDTTTQYEQYLGITYYPLGNTLLSIGGMAYLHTENYYKSSHYAAVPFISATPLKSLTLTISYLSNTGGNIIESNGYIVSGTPDMMVARFSLLANLTVSKSLSFYASYIHQDNQEEHRHWPFYYNLYVIGIKYIPK